MNPEVRKGQLWASTDPRDWAHVGGQSVPRMFTVVAIHPSAVLAKALVRNAVTGRFSEISLRRMRYSLGKRGYELVAEADPEPGTDYAI